MTMSARNPLPLPPELNPHTLPQHVAIIMDGNGRWAERQGLPRIAGHRQGAKTLKHLVRCCKDWQIPYLTTYAFSTENWQRPLPEVSFLLKLFDRLLHRELESMCQEGIRLRFIGDLSALPQALQDQMIQAMTATAQNTAVHFTVAVNYGSRAELTRACQAIATQIHQGRLHPQAVNDALIAQYLYTHDLPDPDLLIRTSGEYRLSNYLLWQLAYTEFYFTQTLWPDFTPSEFQQALRHYQQRKRRYGGLPVATAQIA